MKPGRVLAAWAGDRAAQARSEARSAATATAWRRCGAHRRLDAALADADPEAALSALFGDPRWLRRLLDPLVASLRADRFFQPPLRIAGDGHRMGMVLARDARTTVTLSVIRAGGGEPATATASGRIQLLRYVRAGGASIELWPLGGGAARATPLADGDRLRIDGRGEASALVGQRDAVVVLSASLAAGGDRLVRIVDRATGAVVRAAGGDEADSRAQLLLALLRASGRADGDSFAEATRAAAPGLRWEAMREWLLADADAASTRLGEMASGDPDAQVRAAAAATLERVEARRPCRA